MKLPTRVVAALFALAIPSLAFAELPTGWQSGGWKHEGSFEMTRDPSVQFEGKPAIVIRSRPDYTKGEGTIWNWFVADHYRGKRLRFSAMLKTTDVQQHAGLYMAVSKADSSKANETILRFDNMVRRAHGDDSVKGTTSWKKMEIVLDIPPESDNISIGFFQTGPGATWFAQPDVEEVDKSVPVTSEDDEPVKRPLAPQINLGK